MTIMNNATRMLGLALALVLTPLAARADGLQPLVSAGWLQDNLERDDLVVLDIRNAIDGGTRETFENGHIPGAVYSSYTSDGWRVEKDGVPGMLPPIEDLERLIGGLGIDNGTDVVIVPAGVGSTDFGSATRVYWTFKVLGHDRVAILNGGHRAWVEAGHEVAEGWNAPEAVAFEADFRPQLVADAEEVEQARHAGVQLVDNRPQAQFIGEDKHPAARAAGTIPGARNLEQQRLTREDSAFVVDGDTLDTLMQQAEIDDGAQSITFCNTGHWASIGWFALSELAGYEDVAMYDGSMTDWTQDENRPLQTGRKGLGAIIDYLFG